MLQFHSVFIPQDGIKYPCPSKKIYNQELKNILIVIYIILSAIVIYVVLK